MNNGSMKKALITGITGQDGSYLAELLLKKGYEVYGIIRRSSSFNTERLDHLYRDPHERDVRLKLIYGDLNDSSSLNKVLRDTQPDEIYNLGAQSHVRVSFDIPEYTGEITGLGTIRLLEAIRETGIQTKFYQASSSEMYGKVMEVPQNEETPFYPRSPYACAKVYAYWITKNYRESYGMYACNGILFNHESPLMGETFVTRKITRGVAKISLGMQDKLFMGNIDSERDWGHAKDYVEGMWRMLQQDEADDFVLATGIKISVREFINMAFAEVGITLEWKGKGDNEKGINIATGKAVVEIDPKYYRPAEVDLLVGDPTKAKQKLGWAPTYTVQALCKEMVQADLELFKRDKYLLEGGHKVLNYKE